MVDVMNEMAQGQMALTSNTLLGIALCPLIGFFLLQSIPAITTHALEFMMESQSMLEHWKRGWCLHVTLFSLFFLIIGQTRTTFFSLLKLNSTFAFTYLFHFLH